MVPSTTFDAACPARGHDSRRAGGADPPSDFSFLFTTSDGCKPIAFNPCEPIHFIVNPANAPPGGVADVRQAFKVIAEAAGYVFVDDGTTDDDRFSFGRLAYEPSRYGERGAPIVVSWSRLGNQATDTIVASNGNGIPVDDTLVSGMADFNVDARIDRARTQPVPDGFGSGISWGRVMLQALGNVFGLGPVRNTDSIMHSQVLSQTRV